MKSAAIHPLARTLSEVCRLLHASGLSPGQSGSVTALHEGLLWTTPQGLSLRDVRAEDLVQIWPDGRVIAESGLEASSALPLYRQIFEARPDVGAIIHSYTPNLTAFAVAHQPLDRPMLAGVGPALETVPLVVFSEEPANAIADVLKDRDAALLANNGIIVVGKTVADAFDTLELLEASAKSFLAARQLGGVHKLTAGQTEPTWDAQPVG